MDRLKSKKYEFISISHFFPPQIGGLENMAYNLIEGLSKRGIQSLAIYSSKAHYFEEGDHFDRLSFRTFSIFDNTYPILGLKFLTKVFSIIRNNPDAKIVIHSRHLTSSLITSIICRILRHPYTVIEHNAGPVFLKSKGMTSIVNWLDQNVFGSVLENSEDILAVSDTGKEWVTGNFRIPKERVGVIYNSFDTKYDTKQLSEKKNAVVFASKWIRVKDPQTTLKAYEMVANKFPNWEFILIGQGNALTYEEEKLPKNIKIVNKLLPQKELFRILKQSKIYINSSLSEGLALAILEAISFGNIPVISNAKSNLEIANILKTSDYTFRRRNYKELARIIEKAIWRSKNHNYIEDLIERNNEIFSKPKMIDSYFERLLPRQFSKKATKTLSIVIPVYNEEKTVLRLLDKVASLKLPYNMKKEIIIVNDCSTDNSEKLIDMFIKSNQSESDSYIYLENKRNRGKSRTVRKGVLASTGDFVVTQDADLEYKPQDLIRFLRVFYQEYNTDAIYGNRFNSQNKFSNLIHSAGNRFLTYISGIVTGPRGFAPKDMETCYKMVRGDIMRALFKSLESKSNFGLEPEITAKLVRYRKPNGRRLVFKEIDIYYKPRTVSQGKKMRWFKNGIEALLEILYFNTNNFTIEEYYKGRKIKRQF